MARTRGNQQTKTEALPYLTNEERLKVYNLLLQATTHAWSKGKLQTDKALEILKTLVPLTQSDPYFLVHVLSYAVKNSASKDLQVFSTYANALSSADGSAFSPGSKYFKPNLRYISAAAIQQLDPKLVNRVVEIASLKYGIDGVFNEARHFPRVLRTAIAKYIRYREANTEMIRGIKKAGLAKTFQNTYRRLHLSPSDGTAAILRWQQKKKKIDFEKPEIDFKGLSDLEVANVIREKKLPVLGVLGALAQAQKKVSPVIAVALLETATGNQAVILRKTFEDAGVLKDKEVMELYQKKIMEAKTALDRVETISKDASEEVKKVMKKARAEKRKEQVGEIGKVFLHIDKSGSMEEALDFAKEKGAIIAELVNNPTKNFRWGLFDTFSEELPLPQEFIADAFKAILFGKIADGGTDAFALYPTARQFGADVDIFCSDGGHNVGDLADKIGDYHRNNPTISKPRACVIIQFNIGGYFGEDWDAIKEGYEASQIPCVIMKPETLTNSALVAQAVRGAIKGPIAVVEEIMSTELLKLPDWYLTI